MNTVNPKDIADDAVVLDVREQDEYDAGHAPRAVHIPLGDLPNRLNELPEVDGDLPVVCRSGARSGRAVEWLTGQGRAVANVEGGMKQWNAEGKTIVSDSGDAAII
ncbi:rhodanese-like domain-containing protein [Dermacoccus barathri]|uniref:rhodanese-like domain-containing protein n=1 Tax=Dermacoccus barathri TaxID=322601 RepID=UPI00187A8C71|nr:rhodanese-like domain-containing protein [Dermacoccus barathri]MBE7370727.1 rhodanese-like domain-containing protein [Dermacoccus barathri]